jgi:hypothetical protein
VTAVGTAAALGLVLGAWCRSAARAQLLTAAAVLLLTLPLGPWPGIFGMAQTFAKTPRDLDSIHPWRQAEWLQRMALSLYGLASLAALGVMAWAWALRQWDPRTSGGVHPRRPPSPPG